ncbi:FAD-dependent oxidoreductase [Bacillus pacificus]
MQTVQKDGFTIERGPDSFLARKESAATLVKELGLGDELVNNQAGQSFILVNNRLHKNAERINDGIPTQITPFLFSGLFSPIGKPRAGFDLLMPRSKPVCD